MAKSIGAWLRAFLGLALPVVCALGGSASTAAPLQLVTDRWIPYENLSDAKAPGFSTEVLKRVFAAMGQEASFEEFPWARAAGLVFRGERDAIFTAFRNDERERFCRFPNEPLVSAVQAASRSRPIPDGPLQTRREPSEEDSVVRGRLGQVFVHRLFEATQSTDCSIVVERQQLHHMYSDDVFNRIPPELRVEDAGPAHAAGAAEISKRGQ